METSAAGVDLSSLAPPLRALIDGQQAALEALRAENPALSDLNAGGVVERLRAEVVSLTEQNRRLEHLLDELRRAFFAKKSEKLHPDQLQFALEELEGALAGAEEETPASTTRPARPKRPAAERNISRLPAHLPRIERVIEPESIEWPCGCGEMVRIGEDCSERLDIVPAQFRVPGNAGRRYGDGIAICVRAHIRTEERALLHSGPRQAVCGT